MSSVTNNFISNINSQQGIVYEQKYLYKSSKPIPVLHTSNYYHSSSKYQLSCPSCQLLRSQLRSGIQLDKQVCFIQTPRTRCQNCIIICYSFILSAQGTAFSRKLYTRKVYGNKKLYPKPRSAHEICLEHANILFVFDNVMANVWYKAVSVLLSFLISQR